MDRGAIIALRASDDEEPTFLMSVDSDEPLDAHRADLAEALRAEPEESASPRVAWLRAQISEGREVQVVVLQRDIPPDDMSFFLDYWSSQFACLAHYPENVRAPNSTTEVGRSAMRDGATS